MILLPQQDIISMRTSRTRILCALEKEVPISQEEIEERDALVDGEEEPDMVGEANNQQNHLESIWIRGKVYFLFSCKMQSKANQTYVHMVRLILLPLAVIIQNPSSKLYKTYNKSCFMLQENKELKMHVVNHKMEVHS
jgi:hypothetical protein